MKQQYVVTKSYFGFVIINLFNAGLVHSVWQDSRVALNVARQLNSGLRSACADA